MRRKQTAEMERRKHLNGQLSDGSSLSRVQNRLFSTVPEEEGTTSAQTASRHFKTNSLASQGLAEGQLEVVPEDAGLHFVPSAGNSDDD